MAFGRGGGDSIAGVSDTTADCAASNVDWSNGWEGSTPSSTTPCCNHVCSEQCCYMLIRTCSAAHMASMVEAYQVSHLAPCACRLPLTSWAATRIFASFSNLSSRGLFIPIVSVDFVAPIPEACHEQDQLCQVSFASIIVHVHGGWFIHTL